MSALIHSDVALRDLEILRARASRRAHASHIISAAAVGACPIGDGNGAQMPRCESYDPAYLCANFNQVVVISRSIPAGGTVTMTPNPLDTVFCPVAVSMVTRDAADPTLSRTSFVFQVQVRGCFQFDWQNAAGDTVAAATSWIDSQAEWDPTFKSDCKACPVDFACFTNPGLNSATMNILVGNPHAAPTTAKLTIWGIPYSCCPSFVSAEDWKRGTPRRVPAGAAAPMGTAKRSSVFAG